MSKETSPRVTVVICNYNKRDDVTLAIDSVLNSRKIRAEVIVVDNCSTDGSRDAIAARGYKNVRVLALDHNVGGAGGFRTGMEVAAASDAPYVLLLDNDASVATDTIEGLIDALESDVSLGAVGPTILKAYAPGEVQDVGGFISTARFSQFPGFNGLPICKLPKQRLYCDYLASCCLLTRRKHIEQLGGFQSDFFIYWDDIDWCTRLAKSGYRLMVCPELKAWHKGGLQSAQSTFPTYFNIRNRLRFFLSHTDLWDFGKVVAGIKREMTEVFAGCLTKGNVGYIEAHRVGIVDGLLGRSGFPMVELPVRGIQVPTDLGIKPGESYILELDEWFKGDSSDIQRHNPGFEFGDFYKLSRLISCIKGLKSQYPIRLLLSTASSQPFNHHERSILEDYVEFVEYHPVMPGIQIFRHLIDLPESFSTDSIVVDSFLNTLSSDSSKCISRAAKLVDDCFDFDLDKRRVN